MVHLGQESADFCRFRVKIEFQIKNILTWRLAWGINGFRESNVFVKEIAMTNRQRTEAKIVPDGRATGACPPRPVFRNRRRAQGRADIFEERKT